MNFTAQPANSGNQTLRLHLKPLVEHSPNLRNDARWWKVKKKNAFKPCCTKYRIPTPLFLVGHTAQCTAASWPVNGTFTLSSKAHWLPLQLFTLALNLVQKVDQVQARVFSRKAQGMQTDLFPSHTQGTKTLHLTNSHLRISHFCIFSIHVLFAVLTQ